MANKFNQNEVVLFEEVLEGFDKQLTMSQNCDQYTPDPTSMQRQGDTFWRPQPLIAETVDGMDISGQYKDITQLSVPGTLSHVKNVPWTLNAKELRDEWYRKQQAKAASQRLAAAVETSLAANVAGSGGLVAKRCTLSGYDDLSEAATLMTEIGVPQDNWHFFLNPRDYNKIASNLAGRDTVQGKVQEALVKGYLGQYAMFDTYKLDVLPRLTAAGGGSITVNGAGQTLTPSATSTASTGEVSNVDNRYQNLTVSSTSGVKAGDAFTIAGVNAVHNITKEDTGQLFTNRVIEVVDGTTLKVLAMIDSGPYQNVDSAPADTAAITWLNTTDANYNVFWQGQSVEVIRGTLADEEMRGMEVMSSTTENGVRISMFRQGNIDDLSQKYRFSIFYGTVNKNPRMNGIMLGGQS